MAHIRFGSCYFDGVTGSSYVSKSSKYGNFSGSAICNDEDSDIQNRWDGMRIAEFYCDRKIQHVKAIDMRSREKGIQHAYNVLSTTFGPDNEVVLALERQAKIAKRIANEESEKYKSMRDGGKEYIEKIVNARRKFREKYPITLE